MFASGFVLFSVYTYCQSTRGPWEECWNTTVATSIVATDLRKCVGTYPRWPSLKGWTDVHGWGGAQGILNFLVQLVQLDQQQHHGVQTGTFMLQKEKQWLKVTALSTITNKTKKITINANWTRTSGSSFGETLYTFYFLSYIFIYEWVFRTLFPCSWLFFFLVNCFYWILSCPFHPWCGYGGYG